MRYLEITKPCTKDLVGSQSSRDSINNYLQDFGCSFGLTTSDQFKEDATGNVAERCFALICIHVFPWTDTLITSIYCLDQACTKHNSMQKNSKHYNAMPYQNTRMQTLSLCKYAGQSRPSPLRMLLRMEAPEPSAAC